MLKQEGNSHTSERVQQLRQRFQEIARTDMLDMPLNHPKLQVEVIGFDEGVMQVGVLILPWAINLLRLPCTVLPLENPVGKKSLHAFGDIQLEFIQAYDDSVGAFEVCSLESPVNSCATQAQARELAQNVLAYLVKQEQGAPPSMSRRQFFTRKS